MPKPATSPNVRLRASGLLAVFLISVACGYYLQPYVSGQVDAINTIVTVFSILAGFLIAIITLIGDPGVRGWKKLQLGKAGVEARLLRHKILFYLYLITLGMAIALFVLPEEFDVATLWLERLFVGLAVFVFLLSFCLPQSLMALQKQRYEDAIKDHAPQVLKDLTKERS